MASKRQMGYKCRIAGVLLFLFSGIAALIAVAVIQKTWMSQQYALEVSTHTYQAFTLWLKVVLLSHLKVH